MRRLRLGASPWLDDTAGGLPPASALRGRHEADVVIVGGGITGCATALRLAHAGLRVVLLEARRIGRGSTAASTALLMQEPDADFRRLADRYGDDAARDVWRMSRRAVRSLIQTLRSLPGPPRVDIRPSIYFTRRAGHVEALKDELAARRRAGIGGRWLTPRQLSRAAGLDSEGGILTQGNGQVDPYAACIAFARGARRAGARLHEHSRVRRVRQVADAVQIETARGQVRARWVVIATGYATAEFKPLAGRFRLLDTYVVATPPLGARERAAVGLGDVMLWDTERPYHYARWTSDHRLLFGGHDQPHRRKTTPAQVRRRTAELLAELCELYPGAREIRPEYLWEGLFATTPDALPCIGEHRRYPRHLFALGYGGNGMTFGFLAAGIIERKLAGRVRPEDELFRFNRVERDA